MLSVVIHCWNGRISHVQSNGLVPRSSVFSADWGDLLSRKLGTVVIWLCAARSVLKNASFSVHSVKPVDFLLDTDTEDQKGKEDLVLAIQVCCDLNLVL